MKKALIICVMGCVALTALGIGDKYGIVLDEAGQQVLPALITFTNAAYGPWDEGVEKATWASNLMVDVLGFTSSWNQAVADVAALQIWRTNSAAGSTNCILPDGSLTDVSALFGGGGGDASGWSGYAATNPVYLDGNSIIGNGTLNIQGSTNTAQGLAWKTVFIADEGASLYAGMGADGSFIQVGSGGTVLSPCFQFGQSRSDSVLWPVYHGDDKIAESGTLYSAGSPVLTAETDPVAATNCVKKSDTNGWFAVPAMRVSKNASQTNATKNVGYQWTLDNTSTWPNHNDWGIWNATNCVGTFGRTGKWKITMLCQVGNLSPGMSGNPGIYVVEHGGSVTTTVSYAYLAPDAGGYPVYNFSGDYKCTNSSDTFYAVLMDNDNSRPKIWSGGIGPHLSAVWIGY